VSELSQLASRELGVVERLGDRCVRRRLAITERAGRELEREDRMDEALLRAVVQVADHAPALLVGGGDNPRPRSRQVRTHLAVRDRGSRQVGELCHPALAVRAEPLGLVATRRRRPPTRVPSRPARRWPRPGARLAAT